MRPQEVDPGLEAGLDRNLRAQHLTTQRFSGTLLDVASISNLPRERKSTMAVLESTTQLAPSGTWSADPVHSNVSFEVGYAGVNTFRGSFRDFTATLADGVLEGSAKVGSVDVKDEQLNGHLQTPDFFDAERFPEISFRATDLDRGELTIKG